MEKKVSTKRRIPKLSKPIFHWDYTNLVIGICAGVLLPMLISQNNINCITFVLEILIFIFCCGCLIQSQRKIRTKVIGILIFTIAIFASIFFTVKKKTNDYHEKLKIEEKNVIDNLQISVDIPPGGNIYESIISLTNKSSEKIIDGGVIFTGILNAGIRPFEGVCLGGPSAPLKIAPGESQEYMYLKDTGIFKFSSSEIKRFFPSCKQCGEITVHAYFIFESQPHDNSSEWPTKDMRFVTIPFGNGLRWVNTNDVNIKCERNFKIHFPTYEEATKEFQEMVKDPSKIPRATHVYR